MSRKSVASALRDSRGAVFIEFAFSLPLLMLVVTGIFEFGFTFREYLVITNAAREGARMAILPGYSNADVEARVRDYLTRAGGIPPSSGSVAVRTGLPDSPAGATYSVKTVTVRLDHSLSIIAPFGTTSGTVPLTAVSVMRVEVAAEAP